MVECYSRAQTLPAEWDALCGDNYALKRDFLSHMEAGSPSDQRYYVFRTPGGEVDSILMTCLAPKCNLLMFTPLTYRVRATFVYVPLSVARPGYVIGARTRAEVESLLRRLRGYVIILNAPPASKVGGFADGRTCSGIRLRLRWKTLDDYLGSMRSHYRYRHRKAMDKGAGLRYRILPDNRAFDRTLYGFYEAVHGRSRVRVEKLTLDYFRAPLSKTLVCEREGQPVGFIQMIENGEELVFAFAGLDYAHNGQYDVYFNLLLKMVEYGIVHGFKILELGQTAEDAKLRLGGEFTELRALIRHSHPIINGLIHRVIGLISYKRPGTCHRVFKEDAGP
jgi:hypothetical protein